MQPPPIPANEQQRLAALQRCHILDTNPESSFDTLTLLMSEMFNAPIALISLVDSHRQWFKSNQGLNLCETSRDQSFCAYAILSDDILYVEDAINDKRFSDNPWVTGSHNIRTYAGAPIYSSDGFKLGTACILFDQKTQLSVSQLDRIKYFARIASDMVQARVDRIERLALRDYLKKLIPLLQDEGQSLTDKLTSLTENELNPQSVEQITEMLGYLMELVKDEDDKTTLRLPSEYQRKEYAAVRDNLNLPALDIRKHLHGQRVLLVDDDQSFLLLGEALLRSKGVSVITASNGADALRKLTKKGVDIILTDLVMPVLDGHELVQAARLNGFKGPIVVLSGLTDEFEHQCILDDGAQAILRKPLDLSRLAHVLAQYHNAKA